MNLYFLSLSRERNFINKFILPVAGYTPPYRESVAVAALDDIKFSCKKRPMRLRASCDLSSGGAPRFGKAATRFVGRNFNPDIGNNGRFNVNLSPSRKERKCEQAPFQFWQILTTGAKRQGGLSP